MILADTSVWVEHFRRGEPRLVRALEAGEVLGHPHILGELALGNLAQRELILELLAALPQAVGAAEAEVLTLIQSARLHGRGIGYVDAHLLAAVRLPPGARLWTFDRRLAAVAADLDLAAS